MSLRLVWVNSHTPHGTRLCILEVWRIVAGYGSTHAHCFVVVTHDIILVGGATGGGVFGLERAAPFTQGRLVVTLHTLVKLLG